jgi:hypothetical protein
MNFNKFTYLKRLKYILILLLLIVSYNKIILPALALTVTGISIQSGLKITPTLTGFALSPASVAFGASGPVITPPSSASSGALTYTSSNTAVATVSGTAINLVGVGTTTMTATQAAAGNYTSATSTATLTVTSAINVATQTISSAAPTLTGFALTPASVACGASSPIITPPTSASSGALTYSSSNVAVATVSGTTITLIGSGNTIMTATQAAAGNYTSATSTATLTVTSTTAICFNSGQIVSSVFPPYYSCNCTSVYTGDQCQNVNLGGLGF